MTVDARRMFQRRRTAAQWTSENPTLGDGEFGIERDTGLLKVGDGVTAWTGRSYINEIAELAADDPTELDVATVGNVTTLALLETIARRAVVHKPGQYYFNVYGTSSAQGLTQSTLCLYPLDLSAGTIDRIGVHVSTAAASGVIRLGVYADNGGVPLNLIAEATNAIGTYPLDASTTGAKEAAISAAIAKGGLAWLALVGQGAGTIQIRGGPTFTSGVPVPLGTTAPADDDTFRPARTQASVTGALPSALTLSGSANSQRSRIFFRYA